MKIHLLVGAALSLTLAACTSQQRLEDYPSYLKYYKVDEPEQLSTQVCRGYGCRIKDQVTFNKREWRYITAPLQTTPRNAADERERLRWVIGRFESAVGARNGTSADWPGTYMKLGDDQMDCSDESVNTSLYLLMLDQQKLLRYHTVGKAAGRFPPHLTAVVIEKNSGQPFALDSWFHFNGVRAEVVPLDEWKASWHPDQENLTLQDIKAPPGW